jgi:nitrogen fixation-related uncharacterized protein
MCSNKSVEKLHRKITNLFGVLPLASARCLGNVVFGVLPWTGVSSQFQDLRRQSKVRPRHNPLLAANPTPKKRRVNPNGQAFCQPTFVWLALLSWVLKFGKFMSYFL